MAVCDSSQKETKKVHKKTKQKKLQLFITTPLLLQDIKK